MHFCLQQKDLPAGSIKIEINRKIKAKSRDLGQNHLLTNFVKTNFPKLISLILAFLLAYIKTNFAITQSKCLDLGN